MRILSCYQYVPLERWMLLQLRSLKAKLAKTLRWHTRRVLPVGVEGFEFLDFGLWNIGFHHLVSPVVLVYLQNRHCKVFGV